jgi:hypothetical protein
MRDAISDISVATMKPPVPQKMPARAFITKKTTSGPTSTKSFNSCPRKSCGWLLFEVVVSSVIAPSLAPSGYLVTGW